MTDHLLFLGPSGATEIPPSEKNLGFIGSLPCVSRSRGKGEEHRPTVARTSTASWPGAARWRFRRPRRTPVNPCLFLLFSRWESCVLVVVFSSSPPPPGWDSCVLSSLSFFSPFSVWSPVFCSHLRVFVRVDSGFVSCTPPTCF